MARALIAALFISFVAFGPGAYASLTPAAHAQGDLQLSLIRAVRLSETSVTLTFRTTQSAIGEVAYADANGSKFTLTDSQPETDHLFTIDQLDPKHGYSFVLTARAGNAQSNTYTVLLAPELIGAPGTSVSPGVQETDASGALVSATVAASSTPAAIKPLAPWWAFVLLLIFFVAAWTIYKRYSLRLQQSSG